MTHQNHSKCLVFGQKSWTDPPKPLKMLGFRPGNDPQKPMLLRKGSVSTAIKLSNTLVTKERAARARSRSECRWGSSVRPSPKNVLHAPRWFPERARMGEQRPSPKNELHAARAGFRSERGRGSTVRQSPKNELHACAGFQSERGGGTTSPRNVLHGRPNVVAERAPHTHTRRPH